jgi:hypothetical protein
MPLIGQNLNQSFLWIIKTLRPPTTLNSWLRLGRRLNPSFRIPYNPGCGGPYILATTFSHVFDTLTDGWCGPYVSDNRFQSSVKGGSHIPKTPLGFCCRQHDNDLASNIPPAEANRNFETCAAPTGLQGQIYSKLVHTAYGTSQKMPSLRTVEVKVNNKTNKNKNKKNKNSSRLLVSMANANSKKKRNSRSRNSIARGMSEMVLAPSSVGHIVSVAQPKATFGQGGQSVTISGQEVVISIATATQANNFELVGGHKLNPNFFTGSRLAYYAALFEQFRIDKLEMCYITGSPSSTAGDILLTYETDPTVTFRDPTNANFVTKALSKPGAVLCSVWKDFCTILNIDKDWKYNSIEEVNDLRTNSAGDVFIYNRGTVTQPGYILVRYQISFRNPIFEPKPYAVYPWADWTIVTAALPVTSTAGNTAVVVFSGIAAPLPGVIVKACLTSVTLGAGPTSANAWSLSEDGILVPFTLQAGDTFYLKFGSNNAAYVFQNYDDAKSAPVTTPATGTNLSNSIVVSTVTTTAGTSTWAISQVNLLPSLAVQAL